ncbi:hypothetical protein pkur_cds_835 [Pandoravirus kuranda]|uniref:Uncharacterized protein n=1 Tax=Pandoravirus kuranda TaxID=3019033 RepID=A0AA95EJF0_9VIRU|nr:hypothetical protein pkur_cds_835 [Pandoravirus kuranda]
MASTTSGPLRELLSHPTIATLGVSAVLCTTVSYGAYTWYKTYELSVRDRAAKDHSDFFRDLTALPRPTGGESFSSTDGRAVNFEGSSACFRAITMRSVLSWNSSRVGGVACDLSHHLPLVRIVTLHSEVACAAGAGRLQCTDTVRSIEKPGYSGRVLVARNSGVWRLWSVM